MGRQVFADSGGLIAYFASDEPRHAPVVEAVRAVAAAGGRFLTTNYIFDEVITRVSRKAGHAASRRVGQEIFASRLLHRIYIGEPFEAQAWAYYLKYHDQELSFTDATTLAVMKRFGINEILTLDSDFAKLGFAMLPGA